MAGIVVAGDLKGASWRRRSGSDQQFDGTFEEAFKNAKLPVPLGSTPLWVPGGIPSEWTDVCGFVKPPRSQSGWLIRNTGAFEINLQELGLSSKDQTCHHEVWRWISHGSTPRVADETFLVSLAKKSRSWNPHEMM